MVDAMMKNAVYTNLSWSSNENHDVVVLDKGIYTAKNAIANSTEMVT